MRGFDRAGGGVDEVSRLDDSFGGASTLQPDARSAMRAFVLSPRSASGVIGRAVGGGVDGVARGVDGVGGREGGGVDGVARAGGAGVTDRAGGGVLAGGGVIADDRVVAGGGVVAGVARAPGGGVFDRTGAGAGVCAGGDVGGWLPDCSPSGESTLQPEARSAMRALVSSPSRRRVRSSSGTGRP